LELANNEVRARTNFAMCRECTWQTAPADELAEVWARARRHTEQTRHTTEACEVRAIVIT